MSDKPTYVVLAETLAAIPGVPTEMVDKAMRGYYHDYLSPLTFPEVQLAADLLALAKEPATPYNSRTQLHELARRVMDGEFDASKAEADEWAKSPEGQATFAELLGEESPDARE